MLTSDELLAVFQEKAQEAVDKASPEYLELRVSAHPRIVHPLSSSNGLAWTAWLCLQPSGGSVSSSELSVSLSLRSVSSCSTGDGGKDAASLSHPEQVLGVVQSQGQDSERLVVGLTGYPNVGKSSTINALFGSKKTAVAATPGKTKHFQTLLVGDTMTLCDCPGLVLPKYASSKAEMVAAGAPCCSQCVAVLQRIP